MNVPIKRGMLIRYQNHYWFIEDFVERHSGKQRPTVHVSLRDAKDARVVDHTLDELSPVQEVTYEHRRAQYLFPRGGQFVFMDAESFDEYELGPAQLAGVEKFLRDGEEYRVMFVQGQPLSLDMPETVVLKVAVTAAPSHAVGSAGSVLKEATLENGLEVRVPLFIKTGDAIRVDTRSRTYSGKENA
ncbi:MAG: hypothetical protein U1D55_04685 [Phycisphaerae bacterium]